MIALLTMIFLIACTAPMAAAPADNTPPALALIDSKGAALRNGTVCDSADLTIICLAMDDLSEIEEVEYSLDNSTFAATTSTGNLHRTYIELSGLTEGSHSITVRATNNASLTAEKTVGFTVDLTAPPADDSLIWNLLGAIVAISGILIASILILMGRRKGVRPPEPLMREDWLPPIL
jgi:hypothetical protein